MCLCSLYGWHINKLDVVPHGFDVHIATTIKKKKYQASLQGFCIPVEILSLTMMSIAPNQTKWNGKTCYNIQNVGYHIS